MPENKKECLKGYIDNQIIMGIRPGDIKALDDSDKRLEQWAADVKVQVYELLGAEALLYFEYAGNRIIASVSAKTEVKEGGGIRLAFDLEKAYLFDRDTELAIL